MAGEVGHSGFAYPVWIRYPYLSCEKICPLGNKTNASQLEYGVTKVQMAQ